MPTDPPRSSKKASDTFPQPSAEAITHSNKVKEWIIAAIESAGGKISFADYMNLALYAPGLGYYSAGLKKFGRLGDFITAPEISPLFSQCLAIQCHHIMQQSGLNTLLEMGAGSGIMAIDIMQELERQDSLPEQYLILELSADLRDRQQKAIEDKIPHLASRFNWLDQLPASPFNGIVIANELLDALPVHLLRLSGTQSFERFVVLDKKQQFIWQDQSIEEPRLNVIANEIRDIHLSIQALNDKPGRDYITEVNLLAMDWIGSIADIMEQGAILLVDYGYTAREYYHPQRFMGTLMCHYQHHRHDDPFYLPGMQDITAHVNFSHIARSAEAAGLTLYGFTTQAHFLMAGGLVELTRDLDPDDVVHFTETARQIKMLTLPEKMGELFKVILLAKGKPLSLPAFQFQDFSQWL